MSQITVSQADADAVIAMMPQEFRAKAAALLTAAPVNELIAAKHSEEYDPALAIAGVDSLVRAVEHLLKSAGRYDRDRLFAAYPATCMFAMYRCLIDRNGDTGSRCDVTIAMRKIVSAGHTEIMHRCADIIVEDIMALRRFGPTNSRFAIIEVYTSAIAEQPAAK